MKKLIVALACLVSISSFAQLISTPFTKDFVNTSSNAAQARVKIAAVSGADVASSNLMELNVSGGAMTGSFTNNILISGNAGGTQPGALTNVNASFIGGMTPGSLSNSAVYNVIDYGAVPFVTPNSIFYNTTTEYPTNAVDCTAAFGAALMAASNAPGTKIVYFPYGVYKLTNSFRIPPRTFIQGEGWLHGVQGSGPTLGTTRTYSILWFPGASVNNTNRDGLIFDQATKGECGVDHIEVCLATNCLVGSGLGLADTGTLWNLPNSAFGNRGIVLTGTPFPGGFIMNESSVTGCRIGVDYAGYGNRFIRAQFTGNDVGMIATNVATVQQLSMFDQCSIGCRKGGIGFILINCSGWIMNAPSDLGYRHFAILINSFLTIFGGESEGNADTNTLNWSIDVNGYTGDQWVTNVYVYDPRGMDSGQGAYFVNYNGWAVGANRSSSGLNITDGHFVGSRNALVEDVAGGIKVNVQGSTFQTQTNYELYPLLLRTFDSGSTPKPIFHGTYVQQVAFVEHWRNSTLANVYPVGDYNLMAAPNQQYAKAVGEGVQAVTTNLTQRHYGLMDMQVPYTPGEFDDYIRWFAATNRSGSTQQMGLARLIVSDIGQPNPNGRPNTNVTVNDLRIKGNVRSDVDVIGSLRLSGFSDFTNKATFHTYTGFGVEPQPPHEVWVETMDGTATTLVLGFGGTQLYFNQSTTTTIGPNQGTMKLSTPAAFYLEGSSIVLSNTVIIPTNSINLWPTAAPFKGAAAQVNSNGTPYILLSSQTGTVWTSTNMVLATQTYSTNVTLVSATSLQINFSPGFLDTNYVVTAPNDLVGATVTARSTNNFTLGFTAATLTSQVIEGAVVHR